MTLLEIKSVLINSLKGWIIVPYNAAMDWIICPQNSYAEAVTLNMTALGDKASMTLKEKEISLAPSLPSFFLPTLSTSKHQKKGQVRTQWPSTSQEESFHQKPTPAWSDGRLPVSRTMRK